MLKSEKWKIMVAESIHKRHYHSFISHAYVDKEAVNKIYHWLSEIAGIDVWYDSIHLPPSTQLASVLPQIIVKCRSMILVLSKNSIKKGWVELEYNVAMTQRAAYKDNYRIIPVRIDDCEIPQEFGFGISPTKWIDIPEGEITVETGNQLLAGLYGKPSLKSLESSRDIYISRSWRPNEMDLPDYMSKLFIKAGFRLIGDSEDQKEFDEQRVLSIMSSCGGVLAIVPDRGKGQTSKFIMDELELAKNFNLPSFVVAEPEVYIPDTATSQLFRYNCNKLRTLGGPEKEFCNKLFDIKEGWKSPKNPYYVVFCANLMETEKDTAITARARNRIIKQTIERATAMPCFIGDDIREGNIQKIITEKIQNAFLVIADISEENLSTCIEAGIARGANCRYHLISKGPRRSPPFMFRDQQIWYYSDEKDMLGLVHKIVYPYRRRIVNDEINL